MTLTVFLITIFLYNIYSRILWSRYNKIARFMIETMPTYSQYTSSKVLYVSDFNIRYGYLLKFDICAYKDYIGSVSDLGKKSLTFNINLFKISEDLNSFFIFCLERELICSDALFEIRNKLIDFIKSEKLNSSKFTCLEMMRTKIYMNELVD